jgi:hypothetical protein
VDLGRGELELFTSARDRVTERAASAQRPQELLEPSDIAGEIFLFRDIP